MAFTDRLHNRGSISTGYDIDNSLKFEIDNSESIVTTNQAAGNQKTWTWSGWLKRTELDGTQAFFGAGSTYIRFVSGNTLNVQQSGTSLTTNQVFRDTSAWYHVVWILDTTQSTEADRSRIYINGSQITSFSSATYPSQNADLDVGGLGSSSNWLQLGRWYAGGRRYSGYIAEVHYLNGTVAAPTEFGEYDEDSGIWIPKEYTGGGYGTQGYYYKFDNASNLGEDSSGEGHDANSLNNVTSANQATDTPTNNFSTFNVLHPYSSASNNNPTFTEGATRFTTILPGYWEAAVASMGITSGKWYFEAQPGTSTSHITSIGYGDESDIHDWGQVTADTNGFPGEGGTNSIGYLGSDTSSSYGNIHLGTGSTSNVNANYTISNIVGVAIDADNGYVYFARDNTYVNSGDPGSGASGTGGYTFQDTTTPRTGTVFPAVGGYYHTAATVININFGGYTTISISSAETDANGYGTFEYAPPSGYYALCTKNLARFG